MQCSQTEGDAPRDGSDAGYEEADEETVTNPEAGTSSKEEPAQGTSGKYKIKNPIVWIDLEMTGFRRSLTVSAVPSRYLKLQYSPPPCKWSAYKGRILLSDIHSRRRPEGFVRKSHPIRGGTL
jgi:hypothetical protein